MSGSHSDQQHMLLEGLIRYRDLRVRPGGFLCAVLANDLHDALRRATPASLDVLPLLLNWIENWLPRRAWGSRQAVDAWVVEARRAS